MGNSIGGPRLLEPQRCRQLKESFQSTSKVVAAMTGAWAGAQVAAVTSEFCGPFAPLCAAGTILAAGVGGWFAGSSPETPLAKVPENFATSCIDVDAFEAARGRK